MAKKYKTAAEKMQTCEGETQEERERRIKNETRLRLEVPEPPFRNVRAAALDAMRECNISIKPDRYPDGALFKDTAYGIAQRDGEDRLRLTLRQPVAGLGKVQGKTNLEAARKAIAKIISNDVQCIVTDTFEDRIARGMEAGDALALPIRHPLYDKPIRKVRCFETYAEDAQPIGFNSRRGEHRKYLINAGYAYLELYTDRSREPRLVKIRDAMRKKGTPTPQNAKWIYKGDVVKDSKDNKLYRVGYFKSEGVIALIPIFDPRSFDKISESNAGKKKIAFTQAAKRLTLINDV